MLYYTILMSASTAMRHSPAVSLSRRHLNAWLLTFGRYIYIYIYVIFVCCFICRFFPVEAPLECLARDLWKVLFFMLRMSETGEVGVGLRLLLSIDRFHTPTDGMSFKQISSSPTPKPNLLSILPRGLHGDRGVWRHSVISYHIISYHIM